MDGHELTGATKTLQSKNWWDRIADLDFWQIVAFWYGEKKIVDGKAALFFLNDPEAPTKWWARHKSLHKMDDEDLDEDSGEDRTTAMGVVESDKEMFDAANTSWTGRMTVSEFLAYHEQGYLSSVDDSAYLLQKFKM